MTTCFKDCFNSGILTNPPKKKTLWVWSSLCFGNSFRDGHCGICVQSITYLDLLFWCIVSMVVVSKQGYPMSFMVGDSYGKSFDSTFKSWLTWSPIFSYVYVSCMIRFSKQTGLTVGRAWRACWQKRSITVPFKEPKMLCTQKIWELRWFHYRFWFPSTMVTEQVFMPLPQGLSFVISQFSFPKYRYRYNIVLLNIYMYTHIYHIIIHIHIHTIHTSMHIF